MKNIKNWIKFNEGIENKKIRKSDITDKMFNDWKNEMRSLFNEDDNPIHDLTNFFLKKIDDPKTNNDDFKKFNLKLLEYFENYLAHSGRLLCDNCGNLMEVYYTVKCFHCEENKPKIINNEGNFLEICNWISNQDEDFNTDEFWDILLKMDKIEGNDTYFTLSDSNDGEYGEYINIWKKYFPVNIKYFVSW